MPPMPRNTPTPTQGTHMTHCAIGAHGLEHGWWGPTVPPGRVHHKCCHTTTSGRRPHCVACCATFTTERAADIHRRNGTCLDPATITTKTGAPKLVQRADGLWGQPAGPPTEWQQRRKGTTHKAPAALPGTLTTQTAQQAPTARTVTG